jgi:hypothetical protein
VSPSLLCKWALLGALLVGCPGPTFVVQQYAGPVRDQETIATLRVNASEPVRLLTLDGEDVRAPLESDSRLHIELLPGRHRVGVANGTTEAADEVAFVAEAGKVYRVVFVNAAPHVVEVSRGSDAPGADVTAPPPAPPAPAPAPAEQP